MASKLERISALSTETTQHLTDTPETWMRFLDSAAWFYKYSFADQVLIAAQRPDATCLFCNVRRGFEYFVVSRNAKPKQGDSNE